MSYIVRIVFYMMSCCKKPAKFPNFSPLRQNERLIQRKFSDKGKSVSNDGLRVKYTPEIGFNLLKFIPLYHIIRL